MKYIWLHGVYIEKEWRFQNGINAIVTCWRNVCDVRVLRIPPSDALLMLSAILHEERNKVDVSSHVISSV